MSNEIEVQTNHVYQESHVKQYNTVLKQQTVYPEQKKEVMQKPKDAQVWHRDWGSTWESKAAYDAKKRLEALELAKKDLEKIEAKTEEVKKELNEVAKEFVCECGFKAKSAHGLKIHGGSCERKRNH